MPLVLIDAGHGNIASSLRDVRTFVNDLTAHGYNVLLNLDQITASDLNTETVKLLIINAFDPALMTAPEQQAIGDFVKAGGSLWVNGIADYAGKISLGGQLVARSINNLVGVVESTTGYTVPIRMNSDEVIDGNNNNGYPWGVIWHNFPSECTTGIGVNVENIAIVVAVFADRSGRASPDARRSGQQRRTSSCRAMRMPVYGTLRRSQPHPQYQLGHGRARLHLHRRVTRCRAAARLLTCRGPCRPRCSSTATPTIRYDIFCLHGGRWQAE